MGIQRHLSARRHGIKTQLDGPTFLSHREGGSRPRPMGIVDGQHVRVIDIHSSISVHSFKAQHSAVAGQIDRRTWNMRARMPSHVFHPLDLSLVGSREGIRGEVGLDEGLQHMAGQRGFESTERQ